MVGSVTSCTTRSCPARRTHQTGRTYSVEEHRVRAEEEVTPMATERQKEAARKNLIKARRAQSARAKGRSVPRSEPGMSTAEQNRLDEDEFAFPEQRKEPLSDAA